MGKKKKQNKTGDNFKTCYLVGIPSFSNCVTMTHFLTLSRLLIRKTQIFIPFLSTFQDWCVNPVIK